MNRRLFVDVHVLQNLPPSNINRDDTGSPKTAQYGGVSRARVSSQAWKRAMRQYFKDSGKLRNESKRTLEIVQYVADEIQKLDASVERKAAMAMAEKAFNNAKVKTKEQKAKALFFISAVQAQKLAEAALQGQTDKKELQKLLKDGPAVDIALFGRMVADDPSLNEDASSQVAHAISTHAVQTEYDFYTAIDDLAPKDNAGASMLDTKEFNSSTLYRYANVAVHEFLQQLGDADLTLHALELFIEAFALSLPTGNVNSYANQTLPSAMLLILRTDRPVNLITAFEEPIESKAGYIAQSIKCLGKELEKTSKFVGQPLAVLSLGMPGVGQEVQDFHQLMQEFADQIAPLLQQS